MGKLQAAFFFGSGISIPSGMPSVQEVTISALSEDWHRLSNKSFAPGPNPNPAIPDKVTPIVRAFLEKVNELATEYLNELARPALGRKVHYEDIFSLSEQAFRPKTDHAPNLAAVEFLLRLRHETTPLCNTGIFGSPDTSFVLIASTACEFLHWVVHHKLHAGGKHKRGLNLVSEVAAAVTALDIFTLNHDLLIEQQLKKDGVLGVETGFDDRDHGEFAVYRSRWWEDKSKSRKNVRLLKLHGSLNWWFYEFPGWARQYAIPDGDPFHSKDQTGRYIQPVEWKAAFLSGTIVKELRYGYGFWGELLESFRVHLAKHTHLICCGYGFGDTGINERLAQWMHDQLDGNNRLVILTPIVPAEYVLDKPYWLYKLWENGQVVFVPLYLEKCTLKDLSPYFDSLAV